ncbi:MAG TPA: hypothetical protein VM925_32665 [Labilithrix sp.]|nr:hypothetical protein [Labilithrix sp.]
MGTMREPTVWRIANAPLELALDEHDVDSTAARPEPPPSQSTKLRVLDQLDFRSETLARIRKIGPLVLGLSTAMSLVIAVTLWARRS